MAAISNGTVSPLEQGTRCRRWKLRVMVDGREKSRRFNGTKTEAKAALERFRADLRAQVAAPGSMLVSDYFAAYRAARIAAGNVSERTADGWLPRFAAMSMHIGGMAIQDVKPADIERAYASMRLGITPSGKPVSGTYLASIQATCHGAFERAVRDGLIASNPFGDVERPKTDTKEKKALTMEQMLSLAAKLDPRDKQHMAILLMAFQGLRRSEAVGLLWEDVDMKNSVLYIRRSKTKAGVRALPMSAIVRDALASRRANSRCRGYVISDDGKPIAPHAVNCWWQRHAESLGLDGVTPHQLRHTYATMLAESDVHPKMMQALLGHESPITSMKIYAHVHDGAKTAAVASLDAALAGTKPGTRLS